MDRGGGNSFSKKVEKSLEDFSEAAIVVIGRSGSDTDLCEPTYSDMASEAENSDAKAEKTDAKAEKADEKAEEKADKAAEEKTE